MSDSIADLKRRLARDVEGVCRHYLSNGRRCGRYWVVGDLANTPGRSLYVRLHGPEHGHGAAGQWTDACAQEHGDLLDLIAGARRLSNMRETLAEARRFLHAPRPDPPPYPAAAPTGSPEAARRLFAMAGPIRGTLAETYLRLRGISYLQKMPPLRLSSPVLLPCRRKGRARVLAGAARGRYRRRRHDHRRASDLARARRRGKAPITTPRRAMGQLLGNGVRFGAVRDVLAAGEGIETVLSLRCVLPRLPMIAALSANHLAALVLPPGLRQLYIVCDNDDAGRRAAETLAARRRSGHRSAHAHADRGRFQRRSPAIRSPRHGAFIARANSRRRMSRAFSGFNRPGLDRRHRPCFCRARHGPAPPGQAPRGGLREGDRAGTGAAPQRRRGSIRRGATTPNWRQEPDRRRNSSHQ